MIKYFIFLFLLSSVESTASPLLEVKPFVMLSFLVEPEKISNLIPSCMTLDTFDDKAVISITVENNKITFRNIELSNPEVALRTYVKVNGTDSLLSLYFMHSNLQIYTTSLQTVHPIWGIENRNVSMFVNEDTLNFAFHTSSNEETNLFAFLSRDEPIENPSGLVQFLIKSRTIEYTYKPQESQDIYYNHHPANIFSSLHNANVRGFYSTILELVSSGSLHDPKEFKGYGKALWTFKIDNPVPAPEPVTCSHFTASHEEL